MSSINPSAPTEDPGPDANGYYVWPSLENAQRNSALNAASQAALYNATLDTVFHNAWTMWGGYITQGLQPPTPQPVPPMAWTTELQPDGFTRCVPGTTPVCAVPPVPPGPRVEPAPILGFVSVGHNAGDPAWFTVGDGDGLLNGQVTPAGTKSSDGVVGTFRKRVIPWGSLYEKIG